MPPERAKSWGLEPAWGLRRLGARKTRPAKVWRVFDYANGSAAVGLALALPIGANLGEQEQFAQILERLLHRRSTQIDCLIWPRSAQKFCIHTSLVDERFPMAIRIDETRVILHELVATGDIQARFKSEQNREWDRPRSQVFMRLPN